MRYLFSDEGEHCGLVHLAHGYVVLGLGCCVWGLSTAHLQCLILRITHDHSSRTYTLLKLSTFLSSPIIRQLVILDKYCTNGKVLSQKIFFFLKNTNFGGKEQPCSSIYTTAQAGCFSLPTVSSRAVQVSSNRSVTLFSGPSNESHIV